MVAIRQSDMDFIAGQVVSETIERQGNALIETVAGTDILKKVAKQYVNCDPSHTQGRMFEIIEMTKFNKAAAKGGSLLRAVTTDQLGQPHAAADLLIRNGKGDILKEIQAKSYNTAATSARAVANSKYNGMDRLVNSEKETKVKELVEKRMNSNSIYANDYKDAHNSITGQTQYGDIKSGGTTYDEAMDAAKDPDVFAKQINTAELISGLKNAMVGGALAGAFVGGTINAVQGTFKGDFCVKETGTAAINSASRSAMIGGVSYGLKYLGKNNPVMSGNVVSALASSAVNITELTYKFLTKKISIDEYVSAVGSNAVSCFSGVIMTAAGAALFGPIGAAIAGTVSLIGMKQLYKVFQTARNDVALAKEARKEAETLSLLTIELIKEEEQQLIHYYKHYEQTFNELKHLVDLAIVDDTHSEKAIFSLANALNVKFEYNTIEEFTDFMLSEEALDL